ncbi:hypothetical protein CSE45_4449 [Citreicella sp. SE45]|nr:hypothetical protein CSE45_4449 [Citreicella sp. SE45]
MRERREKASASGARREAGRAGTVGSAQVWSLRPARAGPEPDSAAASLRPRWSPVQRPLGRGRPAHAAHARTLSGGQDVGAR